MQGKDGRERKRAVKSFTGKRTTVPIGILISWILSSSCPDAAPACRRASGPAWCATAGSWPPVITALPPDWSIAWISAACANSLMFLPVNAMNCAAVCMPSRTSIIQAALHGVSPKEATLYCTNHPCVICAKMIINAGIIRIVIRDGYSDRLAAGDAQGSMNRCESDLIVFIG